MMSVLWCSDTEVTTNRQIQVCSPLLETEKSPATHRYGSISSKHVKTQSVNFIQTQAFRSNHVPEGLGSKVSE